MTKRIYEVGTVWSSQKHQRFKITERDKYDLCIEFENGDKKKMSLSAFCSLLKRKGYKKC